MTKKQRIILGIGLMLLFTGIALPTTSSASSGVIIYTFDQKPAGSDEGNEWVTFHNPSNKSVDIGNWTFESTQGSTAIDWIAEGTTLYPGAYCTYTPFYRWLDNSEEAIILRNAKGEEVDRTPALNDNENDNRYWMRTNSEWTFGVMELDKGKLWSGYVKNVVDGDTVDVRFNIYGVQRVRLVGINTPEIGEEGSEEAYKDENVKSNRISFYENYDYISMLGTTPIQLIEDRTKRPLSKIKPAFYYDLNRQIEAGISRAEINVWKNFFNVSHEHISKLNIKRDGFLVPQI